MRSHRAIIAVLFLFVFAAGCHLKDPVQARPGNGASNNTPTNGTSNNASNNGTSNNGTSNNSTMDAGTSNNSTMDAGSTNNTTMDAGMTTGPDAGPPPHLPSSAAVTGGSLTGTSENYKVRLQVGAPHAAPTPSPTSETHKAQVAPPVPH